MSRQDTIGTHKTRIEPDADGVHVRYHATRVISKAFDGTITLRTGGYQTRTTKVRMNQALRQWGTPYVVCQKAFAWYLHDSRDWSIPGIAFDGDTLVVRP